jgi:hypothetical protein
MKKISNILLLAGILFLTACGDNEGSSGSSGLEKEMDAALDKAGIKSADVYIGKLDKLLTLETAAAATGKAAADATPDYDQFMENPGYHSVSYAWKGDRMLVTDLGFTKIETPKDDRVSLSWVQASDLKTFQANTRQPTEEDYKRLEAAMDDKVKSDGMSKESAELAKDLASGFSGNIKREPVSGVGEAAVWESNSGILYVFQKGISFQISSDVSADMELNKKVAIECAKGVLSNL